jgi:hypothetical protein
MARRIAPALLVLAALLGSSTLPAGAATAKHIIGVLNAQRAANGIPAAITEDAGWSAACAAHDAYEKANHTFGHEEVVGKPGYSAVGSLIADTSVLAEGISWGSSDPYNDAPYHLFDLLNPRINSTGAADLDGFGCVEIELGTLRSAPAQPIAYSYPGNRARGVPFQESAHELPMTPAQTLGLGTKPSGPNLLVYFDGPWTNGARAQIRSATLSSSHGSIGLRWLDNTTSDLLAPTGAILVPDTPLQKHTTYRVHVTASVLGVTGATSVEQALSSCGVPEASGAVDCGSPAPTACVEDFATQLSVCGLSHEWPVSDRFSFTTARK